MNADEMSQKIMDYIGRNGDASFANLMNVFGEEAQGDLALEILPNVFLWGNMSRTFIDALAVIKHLLEIDVTSVLVYFADGHSLDLPIATRIPAGGFKTPHWAPVVLKRRRPATTACKPEKKRRA